MVMSSAGVAETLILKNNIEMVHTDDGRWCVQDVSLLNELLI